MKTTNRQHRILTGTAIIRIQCAFEQSELMGTDPSDFLKEIMESLPVQATLGDEIPLGVEIVKGRFRLPKTA